MDQFTFQVFMELITDIIFVVIVAIILLYALGKEKIRQEATDARYEKLMTVFVNTTTDYMSQTIKVIEALPQRQRQIIEEISKQHIGSIKLLIDELKEMIPK